MDADNKGDRQESEREEERALELDPNFASVYTTRSSRLLFAGRLDEATAAYRRARSLDPLSPGPMTTFGLHLYLTRHADRALPILLETTEQFPDYVNGWAFLAAAYSSLGRHQEAIAAITRAHVEANPALAPLRGLILARAGRVAEARAVSDDLDRLSRTRRLPLYGRALLHAALVDRDVALALLADAKRDGELQTRWLPYDPALDSLRSDARFRALL